MIKIGTYPCKTIQLTLSWSGCWEALAQWEGKGLAGSVVIDWRGWKLTGDVDPNRNGLFASEPASVIIGGHAWTTARDWRPMQDDRGLTARGIALTIAEQLKKTIEVSQDRPIGKYFVPRRESGGQILTRLFGKNWHIGVDGIAKAQVRETPAVGKSVAVLDGDFRDGGFPVYADRPDQVPVGCILPRDVRLTTQRRVTKVCVSVTGDKERIVCYTEAA